jgi:hypothetical protein
VPTFTCGLVRSNFFFAMSLSPLYLPFMISAAMLDGRIS